MKRWAEAKTMCPEEDVNECFGFLFSQCNFRCCFSLNEKAQRKNTRLLQTQRGRCCDCDFVFFVAPVVLHSFCFYRIGGMVSIFKTFRA